MNNVIISDFFVLINSSAEIMDIVEFAACVANMINFKKLLFIIKIEMMIVVIGAVKFNSDPIPNPRSSKLLSNKLGELSIPKIS
jgi:hypothetical protein